MDNTQLGPILVVALILAIAIGIALIVRRQRYIGSLKAQGWEFQNSPTLAITYGLNNPPFGVGFDRSVDDLISGTTSAGVEFRVFSYGADRVAVFPLPASLPDAFVSVPGNGRPGVTGAVRQLGPWQAASSEPPFADALLAVLGPRLDQLTTTGPVNLSIDGAALVATGAPKEAEALRAFVDSLGSVAAAIGGSGLSSSYRGPALPSELSVYGHPDWIYRPTDDRFLDQVERTTDGHSHATHDVILGELASGIRMIAFEHTWQTDHTVTTTDAEGHTSTRTETTSHSEPILEFQLPWQFGDLSINWPWSGQKVRFESSDFNAKYTVRCDNPKFASDVLHPRQLEFLLRAEPVPFIIENGRIRLNARSHQIAMVEWAAGFVTTFLAGVPGFVWDDLGFSKPPIDPQLAGF